MRCLHNLAFRNLPQIEDTETYKSFRIYFLHDR